MGAGHRNDQARERARAVKEQRDFPNEYRGFDRPWNPPTAFVAPGFPAEAPVYKGPTLPPPPAAAPLAAPAVSPWLLPFAAIGTAAGLGLGAWVREDIERFKREADLPWYDTQYPYRPGGGYQLADWDQGQEVQWGLEEWLQDAWTRMNADEAIRQWELGRDYWLYDSGLGDPATDGWQHPAYDYFPCLGVDPCNRTGPFYFKLQFTQPAVPNGPSCYGFLCNGGQNISVGHGTPLAAEQAAAGISPINVGRAYNGGNFWHREGQLVHDGVTTYDPAAWEQVSTSPRAVPLRIGYGTPLHWPDMVAPAGTQPSLAQQQLSQRTPRGKRGTYVVPFSLNHAITRLTVAPGSPPVTVPDQVIDPGTPTEPGGGTIVPPGLPPGNPSSEETKEAKPWPQRLASMGFTAINVVTETQDFLEAMHAALPKKYRSKGRNGGDVPPWVILQDIWDNWDHFDADLAVENFVNNQIEDAIYGRFFGAISRTQKKAGITAGLSRGVKPREPWKLTVPEIHFANGQFGVEFGEWQVGGYE